MPPEADPSPRPQGPPAGWPAAVGARLAAAPHATRLASHLVAFLFFTALAASCVGPLFEHLHTHLLGGAHSDALRNAWGYWWVKDSLAAFTFPRETTLLNHPTGMTILVIDLLSCVLSVPFQAAFGWPGGYNLFLVATLGFDAWATYTLCRERSGAVGPSLVAGVVVGLSPYLLAAVMAGNSELVNLGWVALYLREILRLTAPLPGAPEGRGVRAGLLLCAATLSGWYYAYIGGVAAVVLAGQLLLVRRWRGEANRPALRALGVHGAVFLVFTALMVLLYRDIIPNVTQLAGAGADHLDMTRGDAVRLWELVQPENSRWDKPILFHLPLVVWAVLPVAVLLGLPRSLPWLLPAGLCLGLSLSVASQLPVPPPAAVSPVGAAGALEHVPLSPEQWAALLTPVERASHTFYDLWLRVVPFAGLIRFPSRYLIVFYLAGAVILSLGLARLLPGRHRDGALSWGLGLVGAVWMTGQMKEAGRYAELMDLTDVRPPPWVELLAADPSRGGLLQLPVAMGGGRQVFLQTQHHKPLMAFTNYVTSRLKKIKTPGGGEQLAVSFLPTVYALHMRGYDVQAQRWAEAPPPLPSPEAAARDVQALAFAGFRWVVLDPALYPEEDHAVLRAYLDALFTPLEAPADPRTGEVVWMWAVPPAAEAP